jgi:hypothetical protein
MRSEQEIRAEIDRLSVDFDNPMLDRVKGEIQAMILILEWVLNEQPQGGGR